VSLPESLTDRTGARMLSAHLKSSDPLILPSCWIRGPAPCPLKYSGASTSCRIPSCDIIPFYETDCVATKRQPERRIVESCDIENGGGSFAGLDRLLAVVVAPELGRLICEWRLGLSFVHRRGSAREIDAETTRRDDRNL
jgi:hypothetical protein